MKALLICPAERPAVRFLAQTSPLAGLHAFGKPLIVHWLEHLAGLGAKQVRILASDRPELLRALVGDGSRWGLQVKVICTPHELSHAEAREQHIGADATGWLSQPNDVSLIDSFPGLPEHPLFKSYANWINGLRAWLPRATAAGRNDVTEVKPGVWVSARARVSPAAVLRAPCWVGPHTVVAPNTIVGPMAVLEDRVVIESHVEITNTAVLPETFVGKMTELKNSIADGSILINWRSASCTRVPDAFLMCSFAKRHHVVKTSHLLARFIALLMLVLASPLALIPILWAKLRGQPVTRKLVAVRPYLSTEPGMMATVVYHELTGGFGWLRCWPQLWSVCRGEFAWVGNRPLSPTEVGDLSNDFERLWLAAPIGLVSLGQAEGAVDALEKRACASLYALQANWRLDLAIIARAIVATTKRSFTALF